MLSFDKKLSKMAAPKNNKYWTLRTKDGRPPIFKNPEELWAKCVEYFEWAEANPLTEQKVFHNNGTITKTDVNKMRAMTITALCLYIGICDETWFNYKKDKDFFGVTTRAEKVIYSQKFEGASADLLNANIIARDLGLTDKQELKADVHLKSKLIKPDGTEWKPEN